MSNRVVDLEPVTRAMCYALLEAAPKAGLPIKVTHTKREMEEQAHLHAKGRQIPGEPCWHGKTQRPVGTCDKHPLGMTVTNAAPGQSPHNYGAAFDIAFQGDDPYLSAHQNQYGTPDPRWEQLGRLGEAIGLNWGGPLGEKDRFTFDRPHFERKDWRTLAGG